ncbi:MAG: Mur ligase family protein [bacterium]
MNFGAATNFPGKIARKIEPDILSFLVNQSKKEIIAVTGTNGKTTTSGFIASILKQDNRKIAHNRKGANMLTGITAAMIKNSNFNAKLDVDNCILEIDEAYLYKAVEEFNPDLLLVTNLFRDQLDRYGELDTTAKKIQAAIEKTTEIKPLKVILNADDPIVSSLAKEKAVEKIYYGFNQVNFSEKKQDINSLQEICSCKCGKRYNYSKIFYGHLGHYNCICGESRPTPKISASVDINANIIIIKTNNNDEFTINLKMPGLYNAYNALAAVTLALELGIPVENIIKGIENYNTVFGRAELTCLKGKPALIQLIKNPIGATEVLKTVKDDKNSKLLIIINDNYADGRDVSWLWDADFGLLNNHNKQIIVSGIRAFDMAVRLKYVDIDQNNIKVIENIKKAVDFSLLNLRVDEKLYILPTYTALLQLQKVLKRQ